MLGVAERSEEKLIWEEWKRITRFLESSRISFAREELLWASLEVKDKSNISLVTSKGKSKYSVALLDHLVAIKNHDVLFSLVLTSTYALAESYARLKLGLQDDDDLAGGIESWGRKVLAITGHDWPDVLDGLAGIVEVSAVRNAYAHGARTVNKKMINRFVAHNLSSPWALGSDLALTYELVETYRARIKSFMRFGNNKKRSLVAKNVSSDKKTSTRKKIKS
ncbi:hypothetical protein G5S34_03965 [Herbaspirillum frisingense]|uniref:hypothetical protein n=1 Tax=Herbaspirillum frisingense TaxID=92645 RepID=UPI0016022AB2|nr:hypothetical protein [Herbaspirillum frisingense]QNB06019.1 hypothetical protein G5S34_03965 [Herbaspirillum frisingense]